MVLDPRSIFDLYEVPQLTSLVAVPVALMLSQPLAAQKITIDDLLVEKVFGETFSGLTKKRFYTVAVDGKRYRAYPLVNEKYTLPDEPTQRDFSLHSPYLVTKDDGTIVTDNDIVSKAAFTANMTQRIREYNWADSLENQKKKLAIPPEVHTAEFYLNLEKELVPVIITKGGHAKKQGAKAVAKAALSAAGQKTKEQLVSTIARHIGKVLTQQKTSLDHVDSEIVLREAFWDIIYESGQEIALVQKVVKEKGEKMLSHREAARIRTRYVAAASHAHAALVGLATYYGGDSEFEGALTFLIDQLGKPISKLGSEPMERVIQTVLRTYEKPLSTYYNRVLETEMMLDSVFGNSTSDPGSVGVSDLVARIDDQRTEIILKKKLGNMVTAFDDFGSLYVNWKQEATSSTDPLIQFTYLTVVSGLLGPALYSAKPLTKKEQDSLEKQKEQFLDLPITEAVHEFNRVLTRSIIDPQNREAYLSLHAFTVGIAPPSFSPATPRHRDSSSTDVLQDVYSSNLLYRKSLALLDKHIAMLERTEPSDPSLRRKHYHVLNEAKQKRQRLTRYGRMVHSLSPALRNDFLHYIRRYFRE